MDFNPYMTAGSGLGAGLAGLFMGKPDYTNPANAAMPYMNQIQGVLQQNFSPYMQAGQQALPGLQQQYGQMISDPQGLISRLGAGYQQSPGYQFQMHQGLNAANQSAAAGGMAGTPMAQQNATQFAEQFANQDYQQYLQHALGLYGMGLQGQQGLYNTGAQAGMGYGQDLASVLASQAQLAYAGQQGQNQFDQGESAREQGMWGSLLGGAGALAGLFF